MRPEMATTALELPDLTIERNMGLVRGGVAPAQPNVFEAMFNCYGSAAVVERRQP